MAHPRDPQSLPLPAKVSSRIGGFYQRTVQDRIALLGESGALDAETLAFLQSGGGIETSVADRMSENVVAVHGMPFSIALNFVVNGVDRLIPMSVEEPSVVAAASNAARMARASGGFRGDADASVMTCQVQLDEVPDADRAPAIIAAEKDKLLALANESIPRMVERGGGCVDLETRVVDAPSGLVVVHVHVDVGDAMGANLVDTVAEALAPAVRELLGGKIGLRILTNLPLRRLVRVEVRLAHEDVGGREVSLGVERASRFAEKDPFRAVAHNKGFMNGVDAVAVALGQDWRSIEAGAHAFAAYRGAEKGGGYGPISTWSVEGEELVGRCELPMAVGTVGGSSRAHAGVRAAFRVLGVDTAQDLAIVLAAAGLASNLAALRALATDGIQKGHMRLHDRKNIPALVGSTVFRALSNDTAKDEDSVGWVMELSPADRDRWLRHIRWIRLADRLAENERIEPQAGRFTAFRASFETLVDKGVVDTGAHAQTMGEISAALIELGPMGDRHIEAWRAYLDALARFRLRSEPAEDVRGYSDSLGRLTGNASRLFPFLTAKHWESIYHFGALDQFFNNIRDLAEDGEQAGATFPRATLAQFGVLESDLRSKTPSDSAEYRAMMEYWLGSYRAELTTRARSFLEATDLHPSVAAMRENTLRRYDRIDAVFRECSFDFRKFAQVYWHRAGSGQNRPLVSTAG
jgi:hydroxymethylglutaryl-CoA reductase